MANSKYSGYRDRKNASDAFLTSQKRDTLNVSKDRLHQPGPGQYEGYGDDLYSRIIKRSQMHVNI